MERLGGGGDARWGASANHADCVTVRRSGFEGASHPLPAGSPKLSPEAGHSGPTANCRADRGGKRARRTPSPPLDKERQSGAMAEPARSSMRKSAKIEIKKTQGVHPVPGGKHWPRAILSILSFRGRPRWAGVASRGQSQPGVGRGQRAAAWAGLTAATVWQSDGRKTRTP